MRITVDAAEEAGPLQHFWRSTGFTPAELLLREDMQQALTYVGSLPRQGIAHVRIHYLLNLVDGSDFGTESPLYQWSRLDDGLDALLRNGLRPFFELMGNPEGWFDDFHDERKLHTWKRLVRELALHLEDRYGREEVRSWYFESWNEPDIGFWEHGDEAFLKYYDACSEGLREADPQIQFGGPGTCRGLSSTLKKLLAHCDAGENYFTGESGVRLDFVSVHEKGARACPEDLTPDTAGIIDAEKRIAEYIRRNHPALADRPFINDECDPQTGWGNVHTWRARPYYAALAARVIHQHQCRLVDEMGLNYGLLSNDNGFLGGWGNRTLVARFGEEEDLEAGRFEQIKKPVLNAMALLALLGERRCTVRGAGHGYAPVGALATNDGGAVAVLLYHSRDRISASGCEPVELHLRGLPFREAALAHYRIDEEHGDPFAEWERNGAPRDMGEADFARLRAHHEPGLLEPVEMVSAPRGELRLSFHLPLPSLSLILLVKQPDDAPTGACNLRARRYRGLAGKEQVMLSWDAAESAPVRTWEVLHAPAEKEPFQRVSAAGLICSAYLHADHRAGDCYKVRAVDYWGRRGPESPVVTP
ncbi:MAG: GH39 family glycosyl hydrolase [Planctomycetota bacterium]